MHLGRSSGDLHAVWRRCRQRDGLIVLMGAINRLRGVFLQVAGENLESVMPAYTHSQHAQPTTSRSSTAGLDVEPGAMLWSGGVCV